MDKYLGKRLDGRYEIHELIGIGGMANVYRCTDTIDDREVARKLSRVMDSVAQENLLPKTILFTLNPKDNYVLGSMLGNFQTSEAPGKIQFGSAWWFNDNIDGMREQMKA